MTHYRIPAYQRLRKIACLSLLVVTGCTTTKLQAPMETRALDSLYLRGVFSWWEADEEFRLQQVDALRYQAVLSLIADGQPYDFRIGDKDWTPGLTCGLHADESDSIKLGRAVDGDCRDGTRNFKFQPKETGLYEVTVDFSGDPYEPSLRIEKK